MKSQDKSITITVPAKDAPKKTIQDLVDLATWINDNTRCWAEITLGGLYGSASFDIHMAAGDCRANGVFIKGETVDLDDNWLDVLYDKALELVREHGYNS